MKFRISSMLVATGLAMASLGAQAAAEWTWTLNGAPVDNTAVSGVDLPGSASVMGYSASNNSSAAIVAMGITAPDTASAGKMTWYSGSGYGICSVNPGDPSCGSPNHALDNNVAYESILLTFGKLVTLTSMSIGWAQDSDMSVLAYTGSGTPTPLTSSNYGSLLSSGWSLVGQYGNVGSTAQLNTSTSSSYWLIAAYNSTFEIKAGLDGGNDYVKLLSVAGNTNNPPPGNKVSEPAALMLMATGLLGTWGLRRRRPSV